MKKVLISMLIITVMTFGVVASVSANDIENAVNIDSEIISILNNQITDDELTVLKNSNYYDDALNGIRITDQPIIRTYISLYWEFSELHLQEKIKVVESIESRGAVYAVLGDTPLRLHKYTENGNIHINIVQGFGFDVLPKYLKDIQSEGVNTTIQNEQCKINNIVCFDGRNSHNGAIVYLVTDKGTYVKYYETDYSDALTFKEDEFIEFAQDYYNYLISYENNYDEYGNALGGGKITFSNYMKNYHNQNNATNNTGYELYWILSATVVILICGGITTFILMRKKRKLKINTDSLE